MVLVVHVEVQDICVMGHVNFYDDNFNLLRIIDSRQFVNVCRTRRDGALAISERAAQANATAFTRES